MSTKKGSIDDLASKGFFKESATERMLSPSKKASKHEEVKEEVEEERIAYSIKEVGKLLNLSRATIDRAIYAGELRTAKIGNQHRISAFEVQRFFMSKGGGELWPGRFPLSKE